MKGADVSVSSFRREVTLSGTVVSEAQKRLAVEIAQQSPQVAAVKDTLQVGGGGSSMPAATPSPAGDAARAAASALAANPNLAGYGLTVQSAGGRLTVNGRVRTGAEKDLAG